MIAEQHDRGERQEAEECDDERRFERDHAQFQPEGARAPGVESEPPLDAVREVPAFAQLAAEEIDGTVRHDGDYREIPLSRPSVLSMSSMSSTIFAVCGINSDTYAPCLPCRSNFRRVASGALLAIGVVLLKLKAILILLIEQGRLLFVNPFEGFGAWQFAVAGGSMLVTIAAYAWNNPLGLVIGFVVITVIHEIGHAVVIRAKGLRAGWMVFIPFVGGAVTVKDQPRSVYDDAQIGLAGPLAGTFAALVALQIYKWTNLPDFLIAACAGFMLNLVNLLPIGMLDGGRISAAITKWMWLLGGLALTYRTITHPNALIVVILLLALFQVYASMMREKSEEFYRITGSQRAAVAVAYFALVIFLGHQFLTTLHRIQSIAR